MTLWQKAGNSEADQWQGVAALFAAQAAGWARTGILTGLAVTQTGTASGSVLVGPGAAVVQQSVLDGAGLATVPSQVTLPVLTAPGGAVGAQPRWDLIVAEYATGNPAVVFGTPSATPAFPATPTGAEVVAQLKHAANATTIPAASITPVSPRAAIRGTPIVVANAAERDAIAAGVREAGITRVWRADLLTEEVWNGSAWQGNTAWQAVSLANPAGWELYAGAGGYPTRVECCLRNGVVHTRGLLRRIGSTYQSGETISGGSLLTLPTGYRPSHTMMRHLPTIAPWSAFTVIIGSDGAVTIDHAGAALPIGGLLATEFAFPLG